MSDLNFNFSDLAAKGEQPEAEQSIGEPMQLAEDTPIDEEAIELAEDFGDTLAEEEEAAGFHEVEISADEASAPVEAAESAEELDPYRKFRAELREQPGKWFVVHSYAGYERRVKSNIETRAQALPGGELIFQIEVPLEESIEIKNGQRKLVTKVRIPGYVMVRMEMTDESWDLVRHTPAVTGFVGNAQAPTPLRPNEAFEMLKPIFTPEESEEVKQAKASISGGKAKGRVIPINIEFSRGDSIMIKDGSFAGLPGTVSEIKPESGKVTVLVSLFERETPVELSFDQVAPIN